MNLCHRFLQLINEAASKMVKVIPGGFEELSILFRSIFKNVRISSRLDAIKLVNALQGKFLLGANYFMYQTKIISVSPGQKAIKL